MFWGLLHNKKKAFVQLFWSFLVVCFSFTFLAGCKKKQEVSYEPLTFEVCTEKTMPDELFAIIENRKQNRFQITFSNQQNLYIAVGYGAHDRDNLAAVLNEIYATKQAIYVDTDLMSERHLEGESLPRGEFSLCPYIVLKCDYSERPVYFKCN